MEILAIVLLVLGFILMAAGIAANNLYVLLCSAALYFGCVIVTKYVMLKRGGLK